MEVTHPSDCVHTHAHSIQTVVNYPAYTVSKRVEASTIGQSIGVSQVGLPKQAFPDRTSQTGLPKLGLTLRSRPYAPQHLHGKACMGSPVWDLLGDRPFGKARLGMPNGEVLCGKACLRQPPGQPVCVSPNRQLGTAYLGRPIWDGLFGTTYLGRSLWKGLLWKAFLGRPIWEGLIGKAFLKLKVHLLKPLKEGLSQVASLSRP